MRRLWLVLYVLGTIVPYAVLVPWIAANGFDPRLLIQQATTNPIAAFAWLDVVISAVVGIILAWRQIMVRKRSTWSVVLGTCVVGMSLGLPLYLFLRDNEQVRI